MIDTDKKVLDATCGSRMIWFDKNNPIALYVDRRETEDEAIWKSTKNDSVRKLSIHPDVMASFENLPFADNTFYHVVFDPPHLTRLGETSWLIKKYGKLPKEGWREIIKAGFDECMRVLKPNGTLIFKWSEAQIPVREVIKAIGEKPMYGTRSGKQHNTIWMAFLKEDDSNEK